MNKLNLSLRENPHRIILISIGLMVLIMGVVLFFIPPSIFPDPAWGFHVLRSMQLGSPFNTLSAPDQSDISQNYSEFLTWWSPGQYLVPYFFNTITGVNIGRSIAIAVTLCELLGLAGFYSFCKKIGFTPAVATLSCVFIICQQAFMVPFVYYNGGEILLFAFEGWFLVGCVSIKNIGIALVLFVLFSGLIGFFCKSSFLWIYAAGLFCLWIILSADTKSFVSWIKKGIWIAIPAAISLGTIFTFYISKGQSPASVSKGFKLSLETFGFPVASPILSAFSIDDLAHGLIFHTGSAIFGDGSSVIVLVVAVLVSLLLMLAIFKFIPNKIYRLFLIVFYVIAILFFGFSYLRQLNISMEARHFRILGLLIVPGVIYLVSQFKTVYKLFFMLLIAVIAITSFTYLVKGYQINRLNARGVTGIAHYSIDQTSLNQIIKLDNANRDATFVFMGNDIGLEIIHNKTIVLQPIGDDLKADPDDYNYDGHAGPLYIVLPRNYDGPKEAIILNSFTGYKDFTSSALSENYVLYSAR